MRASVGKSAKVGLFLALLLAMNLVFAGASFPICKYSPMKYRIFFSNGVGNRPSGAVLSSSKLRSSLLTDRSVAEMIDEGDAIVLYHRDNGLKGDLAEVLVQKVREASASKSSKINWDVISRVGKGLSDPLLSVAEIVSGIQLFHSQPLDDQAKQRVDTESKHDLEVVESYLAGNPNRRALVVGHSQGSLYANSLYESAQAKEVSRQWRGPLPVYRSITVFNVGAAAGRSVGGLPNRAPLDQYVTSSNDRVINKLRDQSIQAGLLPPLTANNSASHTLTMKGWFEIDQDSFLHHGFVETYLADRAGLRSMSKVLADNIVEMLEVRDQSSPNRIEVDIDVFSGQAIRVPGDSTAIPDTAYYVYSARPLGGFAYQPAKVMLGQMPGWNTYRSSLPIVCNIFPLDGLRQWSLRDLNKEAATFADYKLNLYGALGTAQVASARYRIISSSGSSTQWFPVNNLTVESQQGSQNNYLSIFSYSMIAGLSSIDMTIH